MQVRGAAKGYVNETAPIYREYLDRMGLRKLGYTDSIDNLDCFTAECFAVIASELHKLERDEIEKSRKASKNKGRR